MLYKIHKQSQDRSSRKWATPEPIMEKEFLDVNDRFMWEVMVVHGAEVKGCPHCGRPTPQYPAPRKTQCIHCEKTIGLEGDNDGI